MECCIINRLRTQPLWFVLVFLVGLFTILRFAFIYFRCFAAKYLKAPNKVKK
ncbi:hypothetical protein MtrunA17_Chr3g0123241 [Medicago truncatula]|uniref:Transmembrane protein, putative n=1 Tax=Medicago truncatula TaxID=3880 RepID=G7J2K5_MEDTR|nr:transmembrane protein, putative [Medicago truncatula]RHN69305.1 hypothetical protein MtrunA17_Chr3g0123241 [Medicago truncatula]